MNSSAVTTPVRSSYVARRLPHVATSTPAFEGNTAPLAADAQPATRVRYAWADYPIVSLYDEDLLPAPVFELPIQ